MTFNLVSSKSKFLNKNKTSYIPNFVLINNSKKYLIQQTDQIIHNPVIFRFKENTINIFHSFLLIIWTFAWILYSFLQNTLNTVLYSIYRTVFLFIGHIKNIPIFVNKFSCALKKYLQTIFFSDTRDLWYLNLKLDIRTFLSADLSLYKSFYYLLKKSYLTFIIFISLIVLSAGSNSIPNLQSNSFLSNFVKNNSQYNNSINTINNQSKFNLLNVSANAASVQIITEYEIRKNDTVDKIALFFGLNKETLYINNNNLNTDKIQGQKIFIPWVDGYIYKTVADISLDDLASLFNIEKDNIYNENVAIYNSEINKFRKDTLVLIPTKDYTQINKILENIKNKADSEKKLQEEEQKRKEILESQAVSSNYITNSDSYTIQQKSNLGFIWPTKGTISRCFSSYHKACDIANFSSPPIVAAASGTVVATYYYDVVGYGLAVVIDHGNGLKTLYAHMREINVVKGQQVSQSQQLGIMGQTGQATGIHLHFEVVVNGVQSDPLQFLP
ncbi:MAG: peptidoglycan DD-metalloendopeptidase family protein [candidate division SR1 bacterium]|nr:peptidoglycan DD-metalloendopeptidase family protein [candidate division SR1 bacterium]